MQTFCLYYFFIFTLYFKVLFMNEQQQSLEDLQHIKKMMERSSRFISLSGLSGISAGLCALIGAWVAHPYVFGEKDFIMNIGRGKDIDMTDLSIETAYSSVISSLLFWIAAATFIGAFVSAFFFTWLKSKKDGTPLWGNTAKRLLINVSIPVLVGGLFLFRMLHYGTFGLVAPGCLIFYGLGLINASKYTLDEIRYLGYVQIILGIINLWFVGYGLYFWAMGFGIMHILYGVYMWMKYERK
jgi:hypothetical protein